ncbi:MAG: palindromic element RPE4 domain-containing protein [Rickettsia conorii subsp. raoultii]
MLLMSFLAKSGNPVIFNVILANLIAGSSLFKCFLDPVIKPRDDTECVFRSTQQCPAGMT